MIAIHKSSMDQIRIQRKTYRGKEYIDVRTFTDFGNGEGHQPTKKGVTVAPELLPELIEALQGIGGKA